jgi:hypothetical protein
MLSFVEAVGKVLNTLRVFNRLSGMVPEVLDDRYQTTKRFRLFTSVTVKTGTAAPPFKQRPL